ncbi:G protein-coupled glucose receptor regulating Gpa2-domain-containing protein [Lipomyces oligophaga]|uniref:G protein-coupled glucose receptor regulating Gpa2-domain-containing protein n=1 Tax=Lipomyces oligophaga TaxID=45792 RepID=UPI0034CD6AA1
MDYDDRSIMLDRRASVQFLYSIGFRHAIRTVSFVFSWLSIISCFTAFYWLYRLPDKVFRHLLVFLLIFFDCWRAIVLMWYPIRLWYTGEDSIGPHACQADGFFAALSIEGGDFAVLVIAVHTVIFIMFPRLGASSYGAVNKYGGLYKYRKAVFLSWAIFTILFASLPFVRTGHVESVNSHDANLGYVQLTRWCYLPITPIWYRLVLAWIPRYMILITLCVIYIGMYVYVTRVFRKVRSVTQDLAVPKQAQLVSSETTNEHGNSYLELAIDYDMSLVLLPDETYNFPQNVEFPHARPATRVKIGPATTSAVGQEKRLSASGILGALHVETPTDDRQRAIIERQVKFLLLYPLIYLLMWIAPFAEQTLLYIKRFQTHQPGWLGVISAIMYASSGFFNTIVFAMRERPWKQISNSKTKNGRIARVLTNPLSAANTNVVQSSEQSGVPSDVSTDEISEDADAHPHRSMIIRQARKLVQRISSIRVKSESSSSCSSDSPVSQLSGSIAKINDRDLGVSVPPGLLEKRRTGVRTMIASRKEGVENGTIETPVTPFDIMKTRAHGQRRGGRSDNWVDELDSGLMED